MKEPVVRVPLTIDKTLMNVGVYLSSGNWYHLPDVQRKAVLTEAERMMGDDPGPRLRNELTAFLKKVA